MNLSIAWQKTVIAAAFGCALAACDAPPTAQTAAFRTQDVPFPGGAGSAEPRLVLGVDGAPILSWLEPDGDGAVLRYAKFAAGAFGAPREVTRGEDLMVNWYDLPSVLPITSDVWAAHWL